MEKRDANVARMVDGRVLLNPSTAGRPLQGPSNVTQVAYSTAGGHSAYPEKSFQTHAGHGSLPRQGIVNPGFVGSATTMRTESTPSVQVIREQYWTCSVKWTRRERILFLIVTFLILVVLGLVLLVSLINKKDELNVPPPGSWFGLAL